MTNSGLLLALAFGIGVIAGLRSLTAPAVVSWIAHLHNFNLQDTRFWLHGIDGCRRDLHDSGASRVGERQAAENREPYCTAVPLGS